MKKYEKILLFLFAINCITSAIIGNYMASVGWITAFLIQLRITDYIDLEK